jgi:cobalt-zinc-cadmium efflux system outer membrane protein
MPMNTTTSAIVALFGSVLVAACAEQQYQPRPLSAADSATSFEARSLADPGLRTFEEKHLGHPISPWPPAWELQTLSLAALYFNPELDAARARIAESQAVLVTAAARPNPTFSIAPGIPSPYLLTLDLSIPLESAGKRGYRIQAARSLDQVARLDLADAAWHVHSEVRAAMLEYIIAAEELAVLRSEAAARENEVKILEQMVSSGELPRLGLDVARIELSKIRVAASTAQGEIAEAKAVLAAAIGIPQAALAEVRFSRQNLSDLPSQNSLSLEAIQRDAVLNRLDVRRALAQYAAAESALQLEIARQRPDINIGPGYTYEENHSFFTVGLSTVVPIFNRNQGPIAEAEAHRQEAAAIFLETQAQVIEKSGRALARYTAALEELAEADRGVKLLQDQRQAIEQSVRVGASDRLDLDDADIQASGAARSRLEALARAQRALGELEDAVERPLAPGDQFPTNPESPALIEPPVRTKERGQSLDQAGGG